VCEVCVNETECVRVYVFIVFSDCRVFTIHMSMYNSKTMVTDKCVCVCVCVYVCVFVHSETTR